VVVIFGTACKAGCFGVIRRLNHVSWQTGRIFRITAQNLTFRSIYCGASAIVRECDAPQKGCLMRFVRLGLAFYAAALLSGCQSLRRQPPATFDDVRIPPVREGEYSSDRVRSRYKVAEEAEAEEPAPRGPIKSIGWPRLRAHSEKPAPQAKSRQTPAHAVSNPLTDRMRRLFRFSSEPECTESCDGNAALMLESPGAISEPALIPRGPSSVRADYGNGGTAPKVLPAPETDLPPVRKPTPTRPKVPAEPAAPTEPDMPESAADRATAPTELPELPPVFIPPAKPPRLRGDGSPADGEAVRPSLPPVLVEDPPMPVPTLPPVPDVPAAPGNAPPVPDAPVFPDPPTFPPAVESEAPVAPRSPAAPKSGNSSSKTKSRSTTPRKSTTTTRSAEDDAVLEERLRQSAEQARANRSKTGGSGTPAVPGERATAGDVPADPPLWPKRFGGSPPVGEPVIDSPATTESGTKSAAPKTKPAPAPMPLPMPVPAPAPTPEVPADAPPAIPGLSPTIDLDSEIPRPPRTPPVSPAPTSFRSRSGRSI